jgi:hypothetical protein
VGFEGTPQLITIKIRIRSDPIRGNFVMFIDRDTFYLVRGSGLKILILIKVISGLSLRPSRMEVAITSATTQATLGTRKRNITGDI